MQQIPDHASRRFNDGGQEPEANVIFTVTDAGKIKTVATLQSICTLQGLPKQGKTLFVLSLIASRYVNGGLYGFNLIAPEGRDRIAYFDTESSDWEFYKNMERLKGQINQPKLPDTLDCFLFREDGPEQIKKMVEAYLAETPSCAVIVLDGILDLIADFNNVEQSFYLVQWLKAITKKHNLFVITVLHLGKRDQHGIGHIGSYLDRKSASVLKIAKNENGAFEMTPTFMRSADGFNPITLRYDGYEIVMDAQQPGRDPLNGTDEIFFLDRVLATPLKYGELVAAVSEASGKGRTAAKNLIKGWIMKRTIIKGPDGYEKLRK